MVLLSLTVFAAEEPPKDDLILEPVDFPDRTRVILGRPTDRTVTLNICAPDDGELAVEYGTEAGAYGRRTPVKAMVRGEPLVVVLDGLTPDTRWHYRLSTRKGSGAFVPGPDHAFHTRRARSAPFTFLIEADPHLDGNSSVALYTNTLARMAAEGADFVIDLGDVFMSEKLRPQTEELVERRHQIFRPFFEAFAASSPLFLALGNHEGEFGYSDRKLDPMLPRWTLASRMKWYPNPISNDFICSLSPDCGRSAASEHQNYYAWEWGPALFVVLDLYRYTSKKPPGRGGDNWLYTLGEKQYRWMRSTLESSKSAFKFVFAHQLVGGSSEGSRGGIEFAHLYEWGGKNPDGSDGFDERRPGWGKPIHRVLIDAGVSAFFHGHDHLYVKQEIDGVVYQECPQPSAKNTLAPRYASEYGYTNGMILGNSGYLRVEVSPSTAKVAYARITSPQRNASGFSWAIADEYAIRAKTR